MRGSKANAEQEISGSSECSTETDDEKTQQKNAFFVTEGAETNEQNKDNIENELQQQHHAKTDKAEKGLYDQPPSGVKLPLKGGYPDISHAGADSNPSFPRGEDQIYHLPEREGHQEHR